MIQGLWPTPTPKGEPPPSPCGPCGVGWLWVVLTGCVEPVAWGIGHWSMASTFVLPQHSLGTSALYLSSHIAASR